MLYPTGAPMCSIIILGGSTSDLTARCRPTVAERDEDFSEYFG